MQREEFIIPKRRLLMCLVGTLVVLLLGSAAFAHVYPYYPEISTKYLSAPNDNGLAISADGMYVAAGDNDPVTGGLEVYSHYGYNRGDLVASWQPSTSDWWAVAMAPAFVNPSHFWVLHWNGVRSRFEPSLGAPLEQTGIPPTPWPVMQYCDLDVDSNDRQYFTWLTYLPNWNVRLAMVTRYDPVSAQYEDRILESGGFAKYCPKVSYDQVHNEVVVLVQSEVPDSNPNQLARFTPELILLSRLSFPREKEFFPDFAVSDGWATIITWHPPDVSTPAYYRMRTVNTVTLYEEDNIEMPNTTGIAVDPGIQYAFFWSWASFCKWIRGEKLRDLALDSR